MTKKLFSTSVLFVLIFSWSLNATEKSPERMKYFLNRALGERSVRLIIGYNLNNYEQLLKNSLSFSSLADYENDTDRYVAAFYADRRLERSLQSRADEIFAAYSRSELINYYSFKTIPFAAVEVSADGVKKLFNDLQILSINEDRLLRLPDYQKIEENSGSEIDSPQLNDSTRLINADKLWNSGYRGQGWYVAILDTGIRKTHEMFSGKTIVEVCFSALAHCPNGQKSMTGSGAAAHYSSIYYGYDHGSHVSGIAAGNSSTYKGVAPRAGIIAIQVFSRFDSTYWCSGLDHCVLSYNSDQLKAVEWLYQNRTNYKIAAANLSLGGGNYNNQAACDNDNSAMKVAIQNLRNAGIATAIASGNEYSCAGIASPGCISNALAVGATNKSDAEATFSNFYPTLLDLYAPGVSITSSTGGSDNSYQAWQGTSMATPHIAGAFALLRSALPTALLDRIIDCLISEGKPVISRCSGGAYQKPRINLYATLEKITVIKPPLNLNGRRVTNKSGLLTEYVDVLTWQSNPQNSNISAYRIYRASDDGMELLGSVSASTVTFLVRKVDQTKSISYAVLAVSSGGEEGLAAVITVK